MIKGKRVFEAECEYEYNAIINVMNLNIIGIR